MMRSLSHSTGAHPQRLLLGRRKAREEVEGLGNTPPLLATLFGQLFCRPFRKLPETIVCAACGAKLTESLWRRGDSRRMQDQRHQGLRMKPRSNRFLWPEHFAPLSLLGSTSVETVKLSSGITSAEILSLMLWVRGPSSCKFLPSILTPTILTPQMYCACHFEKKQQDQVNHI